MVKSVSRPGKKRRVSLFLTPAQRILHIIISCGSEKDREEGACARCNKLNADNATEVREGRLYISCKGVKGLVPAQIELKDPRQCAYRNVVRVRD